MSGPFRRWWHEHTFAAVGSGTQMVDNAFFTAPGGPVGRVAEVLLLRRYLTRLLRERNDFLVAALAE